MHICLSLCLFALATESATGCFLEIIKGLQIISAPTCTGLEIAYCLWGTGELCIFFLCITPVYVALQNFLIDGILLQHLMWHWSKASWDIFFLQELMAADSDFYNKDSGHKLDYSF